MAKESTRLGKGLEALIPTSFGNVTTSASEVGIDKIKPNPAQPRVRFPDTEIDSLAASIGKLGIVQPLIVTRAGDGYELVAGERRLKAAKKAGLTTVPVRIVEADELKKLELAVVENVQRADLNPMELCMAYNRLNSEFGMTQEVIAGAFGKSRPAVANCMRLKDLPDAVKQGLMDDKITEGHARALLSLDDKNEMVGLYELCVTNGWSVRELEDRLKGFEHESTLPKPKVTREDSLEEKTLLSELRDALGAKVKLRHKAKGGELIVEFYSDEELESIVARLLGT